MLRIAVAVLALLGPAAVTAEVTILAADRIHTMDPAAPIATAMAWDESGRLLAVGDAASLAARYRHARRVESNGSTVIPGLIDAHAHVMGLGFALLRADLVGAASEAEVI